MPPPTRRSYLASFGTAATLLAGCISGTPGTTTDETPSTPTTATDSLTPTADQFGLDAVEDISTVDAPVSVYPADLQSWLREAARTGEKVRAHAETGIYVPEPVLPVFEYVDLVTPEGNEDIDRAYELTAEGGTRYDLLVGASEVEEVPGEASDTPVENLPKERREFATRAIERRQTARVYPETELGEWARHEFFGGYYSYEGTTYLGVEIEQTDAAFFSRTAWYVLSLSPAGGEVAEPTPLRLPDIDPSVRRFVDDLSGEPDEDGIDATADASELPDGVGQFVTETDYLLAHTDVFEVSFGN